MASYDRRILIPYLQDVCVAEMLCRKLEQEILSVKSESEKFTRWANADYEDPKAPEWDKYKPDNGKKTGGIICLVIYGLIGLAFLPGFPLIGLIGIAVAIITFIGGIAEQEDCDKKAKKEYDAAVKAYKSKCATQKSHRENRPAWREKAQQLTVKGNDLSEKLKAAKALRNDIYSVNIIPARYRNIHASYYLYDYFDTCRENDLDKIIQTMLLDEIIKRMDKLIIQNQEIILNQRMQIALLETQNRAIADNHREEMRHLARMETNQERQLDYQRMIEANQEMTNFFLTVDYIEQHK